MAEYEMRDFTTCDSHGCDRQPTIVSEGGFHWCPEHAPVSLTTEHGTEYGNG